MSGRQSLWLVVVPATLIAIGCSKSAEQRRDTAAAPAAIGGANANPVDTGMKAPTPDSGRMHDSATMSRVTKDSLRKSP